MPRLLSRFLIVLTAALIVCVLVLVASQNVAAGFAAAALAALLLAVAACAVLYRLWVEPLQSIIERGRQIVQADWHGQLTPRGAPEIRELADEFNRMAVDTCRKLSKLRHEQADLHALVDTLPDPILASDRQQRLILMNAPAARMLRLDADEALEKKVVSVISDAAVLEIFEAVEAASNDPTQPALPLQRELRLLRGGQKLTIQAVAARTADGGTLVVLRDVSELARAIQMKTDFVANASHELRTPITAIKIAFETLREAYEEDPQQADRCLGVIDGNLRRLEEMLRDLLDLSRVEGPDHEAAAARVKVAELFSSVKNTVLPLAQQKSVELVFSDPEPREFISDARLLNLILKNLVENSVKYTLAGGKVHVSVAAENGSVKMTVADTGIGIAPEHIDRVFERFYQVDAARSGSAGRGTGLGLAIVKHAIHALNGSVQLESTMGVGTTVTCRFPQAEEDLSAEAAGANAE